MIEDMQVRNLSPHTHDSYVQQVSLFARHFGKSPELLGPEEIRSYQVYLTNEKKLAPSSIVIAAKKNHRSPNQIFSARAKPNTKAQNMLFSCLDRNWWFFQAKQSIAFGVVTLLFSEHKEAKRLPAPKRPFNLTTRLSILHVRRTDR